MQPQDLPSTPSSSLASSSYRSPFIYPRNHVPLPAAYGYLPQPVWSQECHRPILGGPRAVPLRMQKATMNMAEPHQMPIQSLQLSSDRPYSVPAYLNYRTRHDGNSSFTYLPRPSTSLDLNSPERLGSPLSGLLRQHDLNQETEENLTPRIATHKRAVLTQRALRTTRPVANRGPRKLPPASTNTLEESQREAIPTTISSERETRILVQDQKRMISHTDRKPNPSKRIKFNVIQNHSQANIILRAAKRESPANSFHPQFTRTHETNPTNSNFTAEETTQALQNFNSDMNMTQNKTDRKCTASPRTEFTGLVSTRTTGGGKLTPYLNIINDAGPLKDPRRARASSDVHNVDKVETTHISTNIGSPRSSGASSRELKRDHQDSNAISSQYTKTATQYGVSSDAILSEAQEVGKHTNNNDSHDLHYKTVAIISDEKESSHSNKDLDTQLSNIEELIRTQDEGGTDKFINTKLGLDDHGVLETLTNELLLGMAARDISLLERIVRLI
ncbi:hypothetical protein F5Y11DRAFT_167823 [Daldinia sp. FL1419]|nr:hypothetical protein F5Y11DRAFT_167823 [Daldinia sp. FL1419]